MKVGIIGAGGIAVTMARTLNQMEDATAYAVASRSLEKAETFAKEHQVEKAYGSYEEMLQDPEVDLVYVATPHSHHYECMKLALCYGKPVLCEKAFTANAEQAEEILSISEEKKLFVGEAMWTRFLPSRKMIDEVVSSGESRTGTYDYRKSGIRHPHGGKIAESGSGRWRASGCRYLPADVYSNDYEFEDHLHRYVLRETGNRGRCSEYSDFCL